jgi:hypothetical protein
MDFAAVKLIRVTDVCARYGISLRFGSEWASAKCPLPTHKAGDNDRTFQVNVKENYWKCWSQSCNEKAGKKGGDVINLVALLDNSTEYAAAKKLADMFNIENKTASHMEKRREEPSKVKHQKDSSDHSSLTDKVKGYMADVDAWFDQMIVQGDQESNDDYRHRVRNAIKTRLVESFRAGKKVAQGFAV